MPFLPDSKCVACRTGMLALRMAAETAARYLLEVFQEKSGLAYKLSGPEFFMFLAFISSKLNVL